MAAAFAQQYDKRRITSASGGTHPAEHVHPEVVKAMLEKGIDISENKPHRTSRAELEEANQVIVMGCDAN